MAFVADFVCSSLTMICKRTCIEALVISLQQLPSTTHASGSHLPPASETSTAEATVEAQPSQRALESELADSSNSKPTGQLQQKRRLIRGVDPAQLLMMQGGEPWL